MGMRINVRLFVRTLFAIAGALVALHVVEMYLRYIRGHERLIGLVGTFDLNHANNFPSFFSTCLFVACAALLLVVAEQSYHGPRDRKYWRWLSLIFLLLGLQEQASLNDLVSIWIHHFVPISGPFYYAWVIPFGLAAIALGLLYLPFVLRLPARTRRLTIASGVVYLAGAVGMEMIDGWYLSANDEESDFTFKMMVAVEEALEFCGLTLYLYTLLDYLRSGLQGGMLRVQIR